MRQKRDIKANSTGTAYSKDKVNVRYREQSFETNASCLNVRGKRLGSGGRSKGDNSWLKARAKHCWEIIGLKREELQR